MPESSYINRRQNYGHCHSCLRPTIDCFCDAIPSIENRTDILILQHRKERQHRFNTVRIVERALRKCRVLIGYKEDFAGMDLSFGRRVGLLYPGNEARCLSDLPAAEMPGQLVILDGTWNHTKTFVRDIPSIRDLPRYRLAPATAGRYRIRLEPDLQSLSTLEATAMALESMEPGIVGTSRLIAVFDQMIEAQLAHPNYPAAKRPQGAQDSSHGPSDRG